MGVVRAHAAGPVPGGGTQVVQRSPLPQPPPSEVDDALHESPTSAAPDAAPNNEAAMAMAVPSTRRKQRRRRTVATAIVYRARARPVGPADPCCQGKEGSGTYGRGQAS